MFNEGCRISFLKLKRTNYCIKVERKNLHYNLQPFRWQVKASHFPFDLIALLNVKVHKQLVVKARQLPVPFLYTFKEMRLICW